MAWAEAPGEPAATVAEERLSVILSAYTVYLDIRICDRDGQILATGRADRYPGLHISSVAKEAWFLEALALKSGDTFVWAGGRREQALGGAQVATCATGVCVDGQSDGAPLGVLAIHFDSEPQAHTIVTGIRIALEERARTRVLFVDGGPRSGGFRPDRDADRVGGLQPEGSGERC